LPRAREHRTPTRSLHRATDPRVQRVDEYLERDLDPEGAHPLSHRRSIASLGLHFLDILTARDAPGQAWNIPQGAPHRGRSDRQFDDPREIDHARGLFAAGGMPAARTRAGVSGRSWTRTPVAAATALAGATAIPPSSLMPLPPIGPRRCRFEGSWLLPAVVHALSRRGRSGRHGVPPR